jgi:hypothetical protein
MVRLVTRGRRARLRGLELEQFARHFAQHAHRFGGSILGHQAQQKPAAGSLQFR